MGNRKILEFARENYKQNVTFLSATEKLKSPCKVAGKVRWSLLYLDCIVCDDFGLIYEGDSGRWAEIIK